MHLAVDTLGHLLAAHDTLATIDDRAQVGQLAQAMQVATGEGVDPAYADQCYTREKAEAAAREHGIKLEMVKLPEVTRGFGLLPRPWVIERAFAEPHAFAVCVWYAITNAYLKCSPTCTSLLWSA